MRYSLKHIGTMMVLSALVTAGFAGPAAAGDAWLDANGIRIDNVNMNGQHVSNLTYQIDPPFLTSKVKPNVLFVLDNSGSMDEWAYRSAYDPTQFVGGKYFGYFEPDTMYQYNSAGAKWVPTTADTATATVANPIAKGDFLNWVYMTKTETIKELMIGGRTGTTTTPARTSATSVLKKGEASSRTGNGYPGYPKRYDNSLDPPTDAKIYPFAGNYQYNRTTNATAGNPSVLKLSALTAASTAYMYPAGELTAPAGWTIGGTSPQPTRWQSVNETTSDGNATTIVNSSTNLPIVFDYSYTGANLGVITSVSIEVIAKKNDKNLNLYLAGVLRMVGAGSGDHTSAYVNLANNTNYQTLSVGSWATNPATGFDWDWSDLKGFGAGWVDGFGILASPSSLGVSSPTALNYITVTRVRIIVSTTMPAGGPYTFNVDTGKTSVLGILDQLAPDVRLGMANYNNDEGGYIKSYIDFGASSTIIAAINNMDAQTWTPLAETLYEMVRYFEQAAPYYSTSDYKVGSTSAIPLAKGNDPYYYLFTTLPSSGQIDQYVPCAKSYIIMMTDGEPTQDQNIPAALRDYDGDNDDPVNDPRYASGGTDYLDDVALWARTTEHRPDLGGTMTHNIFLYTVFMFGKGSNLLMESAINGGFDDLDGNGVIGCKQPKVTGSPTQDELKECYRDSDSNGTIEPFNETTNPAGDLPLTYFQGDDGYELESSLIEAITTILKRSASGTSVSVLGSSWKGEGSMYQAYFYPQKIEGLRTVNWTGYFHSLFVDRNGLIHEDTNGDGIMKPDDDYVVQFVFDPNIGTQAKYYYDLVNNADPTDNHPDGLVDSSVPVKISVITDLKPIWNGGKMLADRDPADRVIYTSLDAFTAAPPTTNPTMIAFDTTDAARITELRPYLRTKTDADATNLINFVRGAVIPGWRDRQLTVDGVLKTWKLGDIVFSDPVVVAAPKERFDVIYNDKTYAKFYNKWAKRRGTVYVGGNDGMLHAFNTGYNISTTDVNPTSDKAQITFCTTLDAADPTKCGPNDPSKALGKEMWGFIPPDVLPHLAWMADPDYQHTYYVDNMVRVTDARIFADDADHPNGWGTILLVSLRFGGAEIDVTDTFGGASTTKQFKSAYYCLDVTNPDVEPKLLWRFTDKELGFSLSTPTIVREEDSGTDYWYAVMGSGPSNYRGARAVDNTLTNTKFTKSGVVAALSASTTMATTNPHLYIVNLKTGGADSSWTAGPGGRKGVIQDTTLTNRFYTSVTAVDYPLDFKYDMIYYGSVGCNSGCSADGYGTWGGRVSRVKTNRDIDPGKWVMSDAFYTAQPITVKPAVGVDQRGNIWVYVGTGRFLHIDDRIDATAEYYYGFKDTCYHSGCTSVITNGSNILNSSSFTVNVDGTITPILSANALGAGKPSANISRFEDLSNFMRDEADGWKLRLAASERVIVNGFVVGGIAGFGSFTPSTTVCEFEGRSRQYYPYYLTGTVPYIPGGTFMYSVFVDSGGGLPSVPAVHIDAEGNVKLFLQKSTGEIQVLELKQAQSVTGGLGAGGECTY